MSTCRDQRAAAQGLEPVARRRPGGLCRRHQQRPSPGLGRATRGSGSAGSEKYCAFVTAYQEAAETIPATAGTIPVAAGMIPTSAGTTPAESEAIPVAT